MENFYIIIVGILFLLAISDLIVGVSNDAVNFLNSAIGSRVASRRIIYLIAALGILLGVTFSSGMMEIARKGIFQPEMFFFEEIMIIFIAVMITDVVLLDFFNTFGLPTSTTVSLVFELIGSTVAISLLKISKNGQSLNELSKYINSEKAFAIITGILLSVVIAFIVGSVVHYFTRLVFSFRYEKKLKYLGGLFGGLAITIITYFMLIKGVKGVSFLTPEVITFIHNNIPFILLISFIFWTSLLQLLNWFFNADILKIVVLAGTFSLAMAFAGNDLVNFIGVPLAGFASFLAWNATPGVDPGQMTMEVLNSKVSTPTYMLLIAGIIMIITLVKSKKARNVTETEVSLGRQEEGIERFGSTYLSRIIVRSAIRTSKKVTKLIPTRTSEYIHSRFVPVELNEVDGHKPAFDKLRAASNLIVSSILISLGTSMKLPLSTTYVTFIVAMSTSLVDRAWDRESAVYRVSGVFAVIGGWFFTALVAFTASGIIALVLFLGGKVMIFVILLIAVFTVVRTQVHFRKKVWLNKDQESGPGLKKVPEDINSFNLKNKKIVSNATASSLKAYTRIITGLLTEDRQQLKQAIKTGLSLSDVSKKLKQNLNESIQFLQNELVNSGGYYVQMCDFHSEIAYAINHLAIPVNDHVINNHKPFSPVQAQEMESLLLQVEEFFNYSLTQINDGNPNTLPIIKSKKIEILKYLESLEIIQIKRIRNQEVKTRNSILFFNILSETKNLLIHSENLLTAMNRFLENSAQ